MPLPYEVWPTSVARFVSWSAPATISLAEALPPSTRQTTRSFGSVATPPGSAGVATWPPFASCSQKIGPEPMNWLATDRAAVTNPPGLPRRSRMSAVRPAATWAARSLRTVAAAVSEKPVSRM